ncbi:MAG: discoidin domain-containing protein [Leptospiraceae bacterium]|nr:discoidin domain-containing protein [Leptospiraceae bacterium]MDW7976657.1 discoidin domain-containing protein [Leptospiraceae bacterium]
MSSVRISHPKVYSFQEVYARGIYRISEEGYLEYFLSERKEIQEIESILFKSSEIISFNQIRISAHPELYDLAPETFRFEISMDGKVWEPIIKEAGFRFPKDQEYVWNFSLIQAKYIKFVYHQKSQTRSIHQVAIGTIKVCISGVVSIKASSQLDRLWVKENLIDERKDYGWSSSLKKEDKEEFIELDLGSVNRVTEIRLLSKDHKETLFPVSFQISYSDDNIVWYQLIEENGFFAEPGTWYKWKFYPINMRYIKILIKENNITRDGKYISQIIEVELYAEPDPLEKKSYNFSLSNIPYASVLRSGIVRLALDGEVKEGVVVQASDRRLRDATVDSKGIVELASDGEDREGVVVQGNDRRLKYASEDMPGIVRFARNREEKPLHAVQSNDDRLKPATTTSKGIVELAEDGEDREGVVVQGNDRRLKKATEYSYGIVQLCPKGRSTPNTVVQGDDPRLYDARIPLPHEHEYAPLHHDFSTHTGTIKLQEEMGKHYEECLPPPFDYSPIYGINVGQGSGVVGKGRFRGIVGYGDYQGVVGLSETGTSIYGNSLNGIAGRFYSERFIDLLVGIKEGRYVEDLLQMKPLDKFSLWVQGKSVFMNNIFLLNTNNPYEASIGIYLPVKEKEHFLPGDVVVSSQKDGYVQKCHHKKSNKVIGVVVESASIILNGNIKNEFEHKKDHNYVLVAFFGLALVRVVAEYKPVEPGDLLMSSFQSGCAEKYDGSFEPGTVIGKALGTVKQGVKKIPVLLTF